MFDLAAAIEELHPRHDTSPEEASMRRLAGALEVVGVTSPSSAHPVTEGSGFTRGRQSDAGATSSDLAHMLGSLPPISALSCAYPAVPW